MNLEFIYLKKVDKFFAKNSHLLGKDTARDLLIKAVKRILFKEDINVDVKKLKGELRHFYRIRLNKIRIVFEMINDDVVIRLIVEDIDFRGNIYD